MLPSRIQMVHLLSEKLLLVNYNLQHARIVAVAAVDEHLVLFVIILSVVCRPVFCIFLRLLSFSNILVSVLFVNCIC